MIRRVAAPEIRDVFPEASGQWAQKSLRIVEAHGATGWRRRPTPIPKPYRLVPESLPLRIFPIQHQVKSWPEFPAFFQTIVLLKLRIRIDGLVRSKGNVLELWTATRCSQNDEIWSLPEDVLGIPLLGVRTRKMRNVGIRQAVKVENIRM
jgi:hypothetical protein